MGQTQNLLFLIRKKEASMIRLMGEYRTCSRAQGWSGLWTHGAGGAARGAECSEPTVTTKATAGVTTVSSVAARIIPVIFSLEC